MAADSTPLSKTLQPLSNTTDHDESCSDDEHATDDASEPQAGSHPNSPAKSTTNRRKHGDDDEYNSKEGKRLVLYCALRQADDSDAESRPSHPLDSVDHDEHGSSASFAATVISDDRDSVPMSPNTDEGATSDFADDGDANSTASLDSKYWEYIQENGRSYHADLENDYEMPNDEQQNEALDALHAGWSSFYEEKLCLAPIGNIQNVLDIGTGTGIWAIDFADKNPSASVIGTDISPIQPPWVPPNLEFYIDDCNMGSSFSHDLFDLVHARNLSGCISDCNLFAKRQFDNLKPGGYLEYKDLSMCFESDDSLKDYTCFNEWGNLWKDVASTLKRSFTIAEDGAMQEAMERAGFTNITMRQNKMPVGRWPKDERLKETGEYTQIALDCDLEGLVLRAATRVGWGRAKTIVFASRVRQALKTSKPHLWRRVTVIYGQKPK